jgi:hypothetical protein
MNLKIYKYFLVSKENIFNTPQPVGGFKKGNTSLITLLLPPPIFLHGQNIAVFWRSIILAFCLKLKKIT